jgi:signal transduction histidine kinase
VTTRGASLAGRSGPVPGAAPAADPGAAAPSPRHWWQRLDVRLFASYAAVAAAGAMTLLMTTRMLVPRLFDRHVGGEHLGGEHVHGAMGADASLHDAVVVSVDRALAIALLAGLLAAAVMAAFAAGRILGPIGRVRAATRRLAAGQYGQRVDLPAEAELAGLADDVNALARALDDTERRRARLVSDVAHELRTPLTTIRGYTEGMLDGVIPPDREVLTAVLDHVERLERLATDLGTLSRADEGRLDLQLAPVDVAALSRSIVSGLQAAADDHGIRLQATGADRVVAMADRDRLGQVLGNLIGNAVTYTPRGGRVVMTVAADTAACTVAVADTGIGLPPEELERVFDRFYRVEGVERPPGGSGIGLGIARAIARAHCGDVTAASDGPGRGATFTLRVPLDARRDPAPGGDGRAAVAFTEA